MRARAVRSIASERTSPYCKVTADKHRPRNQHPFLDAWRTHPPLTRAAAIVRSAAARSTCCCFLATRCKRTRRRTLIVMRRVAAVIALASAACFPVRLTVQRAESGTVVDATSRSPLVGADVSVETWQVTTPLGEPYRRKYVFRTKTDAAGPFEVPNESEWFWIVPARFRSRIRCARLRRPSRARRTLGEPMGSNGQAFWL